MRERGGDREKKGSTKKDINDEQEIVGDGKRKYPTTCEGHGRATTGTRAIATTQSATEGHPHVITPYIITPYIITPYIIIPPATCRIPHRR